MSQTDFSQWKSASQIDPVLFDLLKEKYAEEKKEEQVRGSVRIRGLGTLYAAFIGICAMVLVILLGTMRGVDQDTILTNAVWGLLVFFIIGFISGKIIEMCIHESSKLLVQDMIRRTENFAQAADEETVHGEQAV